MDVLTRLAMLATILTVATGCDKAKAIAHAGQRAAPPTIPPGEELDLSGRPDILFEVFGQASDPRMVPVAVLAHGTLRPIVLAPTGWRQFDAMYLRRGQRYALYDDGRVAGVAEVQRGMWEPPGDPLYALPGCRTLVPLADVTISEALAPTDFTVELLASTASLGHPHSFVPMRGAEVARIARAVAASSATARGIAPGLLDSLDFHAVSFASGAGRWPTIVATFIDPGATAAVVGRARTAHLLLIADADSATGRYHGTFVHLVVGPLASAEFLRYFGHLDLTNDAVDEIVLSGWRFGGDTFLSVLSWKDGGWSEVFRSRPSWCLDTRG